MSKQRELYRVKIVVDTIIYETPEKINDINPESILLDIQDAVVDGWDTENKTGMKITKINYNKTIINQLPKNWRCGELVPENISKYGTIAKILKNHNIKEMYLTHYPDNSEIPNEIQ